jgi:hypothetical protein
MRMGSEQPTRPDSAGEPTGGPQRQQHHAELDEKLHQALEDSVAASDPVSISPGRDTPGNERR